MKIVHVLSYFKPDAGYQENLLTVGQYEIGNDVYIITSRYEPDFSFNKNSRIYELGEYDYKGVKIIRVKSLYENKNRFVILKNLYVYLEKINPDLIFFHDHSPQLLTCVRYVKKHPHTRLVVDIHSTLNNSMSTIIGKIYHKVFWKKIIQKIQKYYYKVFYVAPESKDFAIRIYGINESKLEHLPLPGDCSLLDRYNEIRQNVRNKFGVSEREKIIFHTGKMSERKKTLEVLKAFSKLSNENYKLFLVGSVEDKLMNSLKNFLEKDSRIEYLGWATASELKKLLIGGDVLLQPGSLSHVFIDGICAGLPLILSKTPQNEYLTRNGNGFLIEKPTVESILYAIKHVLNENNLYKYKEKTFAISKEFHYINIAKKSIQ
ncbi:glycosyltransferase family 4 protein [Marinitoga lauensis]|uniref:glycosyltransferase family 4 protein n=1 Tax=Marinitoga lauensis TaxID=2201189 RepID=UPI0010136DF7|nr:glycosyltransferase family 4 protein [Marinitoga lauensis]